MVRINPAHDPAQVQKDCSIGRPASVKASVFKADESNSPFDSFARTVPFSSACGC